MNTRDRFSFAAPRVIELARYLSVASRIDAFILREFRLEFLPGMSPSIEARLWWSSLVDFPGPDVVTLNPDVAAHLRSELVDSDKLNEAKFLLAKRTPPSLVKLEEDLIWLAIRYIYFQERGPLFRLLGSIVKTAHEVEKRRGLANWLITAFQRIPELSGIRDIDQFRLAAIVASGHTPRIAQNEGVSFSSQESKQLFQLLDRTQVGVRVSGSRLDLNDHPRVGDEIIDLPATDPRVVEISWNEVVEEIRWSPGKSFTRLGVDLPMTVRGLGGDEYRLGAHQDLDSIIGRIRPDLVLIVAEDDEDPRLGILLAEDLAVTASLRTRTRRLATNESVSVLPFSEGNRTNAEVISIHSRTDSDQELALLRLHSMRASFRPVASVSRVNVVWALRFNAKSNLVAERFVLRDPGGESSGYRLLRPSRMRDHFDKSEWSGALILDFEGLAFVGFSLVASGGLSSLGWNALPDLIDELHRGSPPPRTKARYDIPPPEDWKDFEDLCLDLWRRRWKDRDAQKNGRQGQPQAGVDVFGRPEGGEDWHGVQCKVKSYNAEQKLTRKLIEEEVERAATFKPKLAHYTIATTAARDARLQEAVRKLETPFPVQIASWDDILDQLNGLEDGDVLLRKHYARWLEAGEGAEVDVTNLPITGEHFLGRLAELKHLDDAWADEHTNVFSIVAWGGVGKTALVKHWLDSMRKDDWRGAKRVFAWTFYSQGTRSEGKEGEDGMASAEPFFEAVYRWLGVVMPKGPRERGLELAKLLRERKTLLYFDGVEPLQHPPGSGKEGRLRDPGLQAFLMSWAKAGNGLCVVTTREKLTVLEAAGAVELVLEELEPESAVALLRALGVQGLDRDLRAAAEAFGHHVLSLTLLGNYLRRTGIDAARIDQIDFGKAVERQGGHAFRVMHAYVDWLEPGELQVLRLLGLFDRTVPGGAVAALREEPAIPGLTDEVVGLDDEDWNWSVGVLRENGLLAGEDPTDRNALDAHPLVREYFGEQLREEYEEAWRAGQERLYGYYKQAAPEHPDTLQQMLPLYAAIVHGCRAGRVEEVFDEVYWQRIRRGKEAFSIRKLGAFGVELIALAAFFDRPWDRPSAKLSEADRAWLLNDTSFVLRALGRLAEAVEPMRAGLEAAEDLEDWTNVASYASNLSELTLTLGAVADAVAAGEEGVELADRSGDDFERMGTRTTLADALHQAGRREESAAAFREAEAIQAQQQPYYPRLYSLPGYRYCDLLLGVAEPEDGAGLDGVAGAVGERQRQEVERYRQACEEVRERAEYAIETTERNNWLLDIALDHLSLGRAYVGLALTAPAGTADFETAASHLDQAVAGLRQAGQEDYLTCGLLARASFRRLTGDLPGAAADLDEAQEIAERGSMQLHLADTHLERTRLHLFQHEDPATAQVHFEQARRIVEETGYGRRDREVRFLSERQGEAA